MNDWVFIDTSIAAIQREKLEAAIRDLGTSQYAEDNWQRQISNSLVYILSVLEDIDTYKYGWNNTSSGGQAE